jgi:hypothetical protein
MISPNRAVQTMKKTLILCGAVLASLLATAPGAQAWSAFGHETIALIAWNQMNASQQAAISKIMAANVPIFGSGPGTAPLLEGAIWPDEVRFEADHSTPNVPLAIFGALGITMSHQSNNLHFVDYKGAYPVLPDGQSAIVAITTAQAVLQNPASTMREQGEALTYLIHCVGDIHQPLHAGNKSDDGGNSIEIKGIGPTTSKAKTELHAVWDEGLFATTGVTDPAQYITAYLDGPITQAKATALSDMNPADWATNSHHLALTVAYVDEHDHTIMSGAHLSPAYVKEALVVANKQLAIAGIRLAALLNEDFK